MSDWRQMFQGGAMSPAMAIAAGLISGSGRSTDPAALQKGLASGMMNAQQAQALLNKEKADARRMELQEAQHGLNQERLQAALDRDRLAATEQQRQVQRQMDADQRMEGMRSQFFGDGAPPVDGVGPSRPGALADVNPLKAAAAKMAFESGDAGAFNSIVNPKAARRNLTPFFAMDPETKQPAAYQLTDSGPPIPVELPGKQIPLRSTQTLDYGGGIRESLGGVVIRDTGRTLKPSETPDYKQDVAAASKEGAATGQASFDLPGTLSGIKSMRETINGIITHESLPYATGRLRNITGLTAGIKGGPLSDFDSRMDQLEGGAFLQASEKLSGVMTESDAVRGISDFSRARNTLEPDELIAAGEDALRRLDEAEALAYKKAGKERPRQEVAPLSDDDLLKAYGID